MNIFSLKLHKHFDKFVHLINIEISEFLFLPNKKKYYGNGIKRNLLMKFKKFLNKSINNNIISALKHIYVSLSFKLNTLK
jgi:hypothetical protein